MMLDTRCTYSRITAMPKVTGKASHQKYLQYTSATHDDDDQKRDLKTKDGGKETYTCEFFKGGNSSKFIPKYPDRKVRGRNKMVTKVNCCMLSFWYAPMVLKMRLIMLSLCVRIWSSEAMIMIQ